MSKIFESMTIEEQQAWWLVEAGYALQGMNKPDAHVEWLSYTHHPVFKVMENDSTYILHMFIHENYRWDKLFTVASWLTLMRTAGQFSVPQPVLRGNNFLTYQGMHDEIAWNGILYHYLEGVSRNPDEVTTDELKRIGEFLAKTHQFSTDCLKQFRSFNPDSPISSDINGLILTSIGFAHSQLTRLDWDGLFSRDGIYYPGDENMTVFSNEQLSVMDAVAEKVKSAMDEIGQGEDGFGLIHGDFLLKNILFHENEVRALDFEYCGWGYYLYDLTPILWQLKPQARYPQLEQALWDGYTGIRPLTEGHRELLETFIAGRQVASMRWIAANQQNPYVAGKVESILAQRTVELSAFLETGILKRE